MRGWLLSLEGFSMPQLLKLLAVYQSAERAIEAKSWDWLSKGVISEEQYHKVRTAWNESDWPSYAERLHQADVRLIMPGDHTYPQMLSSIEDAPALLHVKGLELAADLPYIAVVGSRKASQYGKRVAKELAADLGDCGIGIVSGLARGIDSAAHEGVLSVKRGLTAAIVATGLDKVYPKENHLLAQQIEAKGAIYSEYPLKTEPLAFRFPERNRIIAGFSLGVVVVEAAEKSGTQITVTHALNQGREVFAVPGSIYTSNSHGPHQLLRQGACLVENAHDILEELGLWQSLSKEPASKWDLTSELSLMQKQIMGLLVIEPLHFDQVQSITGFPPGTLLSELLNLELEGYILCQPGRIYSLSR